ncbi:MAG TPA: rod shape-determining protein MreD [Candidatus Limnocylindrales bacterium]|jgi:rod shape-determining protein MreD
MTLVLAAVGAAVAALLELTVAPSISVAGAHPHFVVMLGVIAVVATGLETGLVWAFVGGLLLDILAPRPLGSTAFTLLLSLGGAYVGARVLSRLGPLAPILLVFVFSVVNSLLLLGVFGALRSPIPVSNPVGAVVPGALYDVILAALLSPLVLSLRSRFAPAERAEW